MPERDVLLEVNDLKRHFDVSAPALERLLQGKQRTALKALDGVTFSIRRGETFSLVGESGCGKTTVARCVVGLYRPTAGNIVFDGVDLGSLKHRNAMAPIRRRMQMIFQDPYASLNPRCAEAHDRCRRERPDLMPAKETEAACWQYAPVAEPANA